MAYYDISQLDSAAMGKRIVDNRNRKGWSRDRLAAECGVSAAALAYMEAGGRKRGDKWEPANPTLGTLFLICNSLDVSMDYLTGIDFSLGSKTEEVKGRSISLSGLIESDRMRLIAIRDVFQVLETQELEAANETYGSLYRDNG